MNFIIIGTGGIGAFYGAKLMQGGNKVLFVARGKHLDAIRDNGLNVIHPDLEFNQIVDVCELNEINNYNFPNIDVILLTTKSYSTKEVSILLKNMFKTNMPYIVSLQNGIVNENILLEYFQKNKVIGGLSRKLGSFIKEFGIIEGTGNPETIVGAMFPNTDNRDFLLKLKNSFIKSNLSFNIIDNIRKDLWIKLIINNGVNALCTLLKVKTRIIMNDEKLKKIVYGLMNETAIAAKNKDIIISKNDVDDMFELITRFDSIKPSMLVDREFHRVLELEDICGIVIKNCEEQNLDAPYTRTISTLLEYEYKKEINKQ